MKFEKTSNHDELIGDEEQTSDKSEENKRDRGTKGETSYLDELTREEEQNRKKRRNGIEPQMEQLSTLMRSYGRKNRIEHIRKKSKVI